MPITSQESLPSRMRSPSGSRPPKSSRCTVAPSRHTALPARSSLSVNERPPESVQPRTVEERRACCR